MIRIFAHCALLLWLLAGDVLAEQSPPRGAGEYPLTQDSLPQVGVKRGSLEGPFEFHSTILANTVRRYWIYIPAHYNRKQPPALLLFHDGQRAISAQGSLHVPSVLDNLIARGDIPSTLAIFITPGNLSEQYPDDLGLQNPNNRMAEYDSLSDKYARMLVEELLPSVARRYPFSNDPNRRIIGGSSSGALAAFTVAWLRPEAFARVISLIGSYTSIGYQPATANNTMQPGGDIYPTLIRKSPIRPLRIFLQDGRGDLDNEHGNWFLANQQILSALQWANTNADRLAVGGARYDINYVWGEGGHSDQHGGALLPDILRWMWRDEKKTKP